MRVKELKETIAGHNPDAVFAEGHDDALAGYSSDGKAIYYADKIVKTLVERDGMTTEEAVEWIDYNVMGVQCNGEGFIMMYEHIE